MAHRHVLAIDGGGIRGIIPALVIDHLEQLAGKPACELFDLMVGTSTGGILALGLSLGNAQPGATPCRYTGAELAAFYKEHGAAIFSRSLWRRVNSLSGVLDETYPHAPLERVLAQYFGDTTLGNATCHTMVTSYDIERRDTLFLKSWHPVHAGVHCRDAARATSAAPTYFEPASLGLDGERRALIDGGVFVNSPAVSAYAEAIKHFPGDEISVLSLGSGELIRPIALEEARDWGKVGWVLPLLDCMFDGVSKATDYQMRLFLGSRYQRLQIDLDFASDDMDDASRGNILNLERTAGQLIDANSARLKAIAEELVRGAPGVTVV